MEGLQMKGRKEWSMDISLAVLCLESEAWDRFEELQVLYEQLHAPTSLSQPAPPAQLQNTTLYLQRVN